MDAESAAMLALRGVSATALSVTVYLMVRYRERWTRGEVERYRRLEAAMPGILRGRGLSRRQVAAGLMAITAIFAATALLLWADFADSAYYRLSARMRQVEPYPRNPVGFWMAATAGLFMWAHGAVKLARRRTSTPSSMRTSVGAAGGRSGTDTRRRGGAPGLRGCGRDRLVRALDIGADFVLGGALIAVGILYYWSGR